MLVLCRSVVLLAFGFVSFEIDYFSREVCFDGAGLCSADSDPSIYPFLAMCDCCLGGGSSLADTDLLLSVR